MIENLPTYISVVFIFTTAITLALFMRVIKKSSLVITKQTYLRILFTLLSWLVVQATLSLNNVYNSEVNTLPPSIVVFGILPPFLMIIVLFFTERGRWLIDSLPLINLTYLNAVRIPVELVLFWLFLNQAVPELMTFEGRNFDIIAGLSAPFVAYFGYFKNKINKKMILVWNVVCLVLLINIIIHAFLSAPSPLQSMAFEQPNIAILNYPFNWLPTFIVPIVLFGHLASIRQLMLKKNQMKIGCLTSNQ